MVQGCAQESGGHNVYHDVMGDPLRQGRWSQACPGQGMGSGAGRAVPTMAGHLGGMPRVWSAAVSPLYACSDPGSAGLNPTPSAWPSPGPTLREWLRVVRPGECLPWGWDACPREALAWGGGGARTRAAFTWHPGVAPPDPCNPGPLASLPADMGPSGWSPTVGEAVAAAGCRHGNARAGAPLGRHHPHPSVGPLGSPWS